MSDSLDRASPDSAQSHRVTVIQGRCEVSADPRTVMTTVLGSCVSACLWDLTASVGGMNHFLLPGPATEPLGEGLRHGVHAMELLLNGLFRAGARRAKLQARLFGGAQFAEGWGVGAANAEFASAFLEREGIAWLGGSLGGRSARRIEFWPTTGRTRQRLVSQGERIFDSERRTDARRPRASGFVELF
jgi:chemotaxis protein CheD